MITSRCVADLRQILTSEMKIFNFFCVYFDFHTAFGLQTNFNFPELFTSTYTLDTSKFSFGFYIRFSQFKFFLIFPVFEISLSDLTF